MLLCSFTSVCSLPSSQLFQWYVRKVVRRCNACRNSGADEDSPQLYLSWHDIRRLVDVVGQSSPLALVTHVTGSCAVVATDATLWEHMATCVILDFRT
eukprot:944034-Amphidinium_carterae.1